MTKSPQDSEPGPGSAAVARLFLRLFFGRAEADEVVRDLQELSEGRSRLGRTVYLWTELLKYPWRSLADHVRYRAAERANNRDGRIGMAGIWKDMRYALRSLVRNVGFTGMVVSILSLSMGATAAIVSVVKGVLLDPLPVEEPERVFSVWLDGQDGRRSRMTPGNFTDIRDLQEVFGHAAAFRGHTASLARSGAPLFLRGGEVTPGYFEALGVRLLLGRGFAQQDVQAGAAPVVVLSHGIWQRAFGSDPQILGKVVDLSGLGAEVIGVAPPGLFPLTATVGGEIPFTTSGQDFFVPLRWSTEFWSNRFSHLLGTIARLSPGVSAASAQAALVALNGRLSTDQMIIPSEHLVMNPFTEEVVGDLRFALLAILGTVGLVLIIAVVNVGALFVLRADDRRGELDIRVAMGAPWGRLVRQLLLESTAVVGMAALGATVVAAWAIGLMRRLVPYQIPRLAEVEVDGTTLTLTFVMGLVLASGFGLFTALRSLRSHSCVERRHATAGIQQRKLQGGVVAVQAGLGVIVLVGAMLLTRSFVALRSVDPGFAAMETWVLELRSAGAPLDELLDRVRAMPGVAAAAFSYDHPLERNWGDGFRIQGVELDPNGASPGGSLRPFGEGYFEAAGIEVVEGRVPDALDLSGAAAYAVVNETLRDLYFPEGNAVGSTLIVPSAGRMFGEDQAAFEVLGVVADVRFLGPDTPAQAAFYLPLTHFPVGGSTMLVRPERAEIDILAGVRGIVRETDSSIAIQTAQRLQDLLDDELARPRFNMMLLFSFAAMGLVLCGLGVYGLVGRVVVMRFREIGIRMALGADSRSLARSVMESAIRPMLLGGAVGTVAALGLVRLLRSLLFEVSPGDPVSFVVSPIFLLLVGAFAAVIPIRRAISIDPAQTLRNE